jgi:hypothetical protein
VNTARRTRTTETGWTLALDLIGFVIVLVARGAVSASRLDQSTRWESRRRRLMPYGHKCDLPTPDGWIWSEEDHMLAYDYPLLGVFWSIVIFGLWMLWIFIVIWCFIDNFRRRDHHGIAKALWFLFIVFVPIIGVFSYLVTRPPTVDAVVVTQ